MVGTSLQTINAQGVDMSGVSGDAETTISGDLSHANLSGSDLRGVDLSGADLRWADLSNADLRNANLQGTNLQHANLTGADLREARLEDTDFTMASLPFGDVQLLFGATVDSHTLWPDADFVPARQGVIMSMSCPATESTP